jgi:NAD(P)-dependent dehydrogenase (short-subunit alcohol dehydrogenase family)
MELTGKVELVTGAARGIGRAIALGLAAAGAAGADVASTAKNDLPGRFVGETNAPAPPSQGRRAAPFSIEFLVYGICASGATEVDPWRA